MQTYALGAFGAPPSTIETLRREQAATTMRLRPRMCMLSFYALADPGGSMADPLVRVPGFLLANWLTLWFEAPSVRPYVVSAWKGIWSRLEALKPRLRWRMGGSTNEDTRLETDGAGLIISAPGPRPPPPVLAHARAPWRRTSSPGFRLPDRPHPTSLRSGTLPHFASIHGLSAATRGFWPAPQGFRAS